MKGSVKRTGNETETGIMTETGSETGTEIAIETVTEPLTKLLAAQREGGDAQLRHRHRMTEPPGGLRNGMFTPLFRIK